MKKFNYFDCHADTLTCLNEEQDTLHKNHGNLDLDRADAFTKKYTQIFALWSIRKEMPENPEEKFLRLYERACTLLENERERMVWCRNGKEMEAAHQEGKAAAFLSVEDLSIMGDLGERLGDLGIRFAMLTWNYENIYGAGSPADQSGGLTDPGKSMVEKLLAQGIMMDISHLSDAGSEDIFSMTDRPVMASHSNVRDIYHKPRNLKKLQIQELIRRKGLIGMNLFSEFVGENPELSDILRHMDYILNMGGEDVLALGCDLDGTSNRFPKGFTGVESIPCLREMMEKAGFGKKLTDKIFFENARNFILQNI